VSPGEPKRSEAPGSQSGSSGLQQWRRVPWSTCGQERREHRRSQMSPGEPKTGPRVTKRVFQAAAMEKGPFWTWSTCGRKRREPRRGQVSIVPGACKIVP
jgi:hypothetical protein